MMLGDLGADVIKVEQPGSGDETRSWGPPFDGRGESAYFLSINRNKLGVVADLGTPPGQRLVRELIAGADVVVDNFRPGALSRFGLDPDQAIAERTSLVWMTITGFGPESPRPGYDYVVQAECGWMSITGETEGEPTKSGVALADVITGKDAAIAILGALVKRGQTGKGTRLFASLAASATAALINAAQNALVSGREARRWGNGHPNLVPYQLFHAADRPIVIAVGNDAQWRVCARVLELHELASDESLATNAGRVRDRERVVSAVGNRVRERRAADWLERFEREGVPSGLVRTVLEALERVDASPLTGIAPAIAGGVRLPPPRLDEHGDAIRARGWEVFAPP